MNQSEVNLIYDYLHEYYYYNEGELICKKNIKRGKRIGEVLGTVYTPSGGGNPFLKAKIRINKKIVILPIAKLVYIYFNKKYIKYLRFINKNSFDNRIENLDPSSVQELSVIKNSDRQNKGYYIKKSGGKIRYHASISHRYENIKCRVKLGVYDTEDDAQSAYRAAQKFLIKNSSSSPDVIRSYIRSKFPNGTFRKSVSPYKGVSKNHGNWSSEITINKNRYYLGTFETPEEAHKAYLKAKEDYETTKTLPSKSSK